MFNSNENFSAEWCFNKIASEEGNTYNDKDDEFRCKKLQPAVQSPQEDYFPVSNRQSSKGITAYF